MPTIFNSLLHTFLIAFGVVIGASLFSGIGALINNHPPLKTMIDVSSSIKIWAAVVGLGGTFSSFQIIEQGLLKGEVRSILKQIAFIVSALAGSNLAFSVIKLLEKCGQLWEK